jgi:hypothetical protein|nr:hypothetical protein [Phenylobacterium sp.]
MHRIALLAAAAALIALPASAQSIRLSTAGKSPAQVREEVFKAATKLCGAKDDGSILSYDEMRACVDDTTRDTLDPAAAPRFVPLWS